MDVTIHRTRGARLAAVVGVVVASVGLAVSPHTDARAAVSSGFSGCSGAAPQRISHVVVVVMENHGESAIMGSPAAPYINSLATHCAHATSYHAVSHPSLPNYLAMTAGSTFGITDDLGPASHRITASSVFLQLNGNWLSYEDSMPTACDPNSAGLYAVKHNPAAYYTSLGDCRTQDVPLPASPNFGAVLTFVTPNLVHDMHDGTITQGDQWLATFVPRVLASPEYRAGSLALFVVWDENGGTDSSPDNRVPCIVVAPSVRPGSTLATYVTHYSLLATTEDLLGLPRIANAIGASTLDGLLQHTQPSPPAKIYTTVTPLLELGHPDIVRAHLTHGTTTAHGNAPIYEGVVTLWMHNADTTRWTFVGNAKTNTSGWTYIATQPRWWTAYRWTFSGTTLFYGTTGSTVAT
jgi:phosphatidylinositol-3-phosphatase